VLARASHSHSHSHSLGRIPTNPSLEIVGQFCDFTQSGWQEDKLISTVEMRRRSCIFAVIVTDTFTRDCHVRVHIFYIHVRG
jgi:hypothetical protein